MKVTLWGTRGSLASPGPDTVRYGGNTSCASVVGKEGTLLVLDAGTGIRLLGASLPANTDCVHILLTHLHMDHLQGLPFFAPLRRPGVEIHIYGPASMTVSLSTRLQRYLSPPLFPVNIREITSELHFHELPADTVEIGEFRVKAELVIHPNPTIGYRIEGEKGTVTYLPDHEPALGRPNFVQHRDWTSGYRLAEGSDLLIHDAQYTADEYKGRLGFGHSSILHTFQFAQLTNVGKLVPFHHDPTHCDDDIDQMIENTMGEFQPSFGVVPGKEGTILVVGD